MLYGFKYDHVHIWRIAMTELIVFMGMAFVIAARDYIALSNIADMRFLFSPPGVLTHHFSSQSSPVKNIGLS